MERVTPPGEVMEEGCARVAESRYIGCQRVDDLRTLSWGSAPSAAIILEAGLKVEAGHSQR